VRDELKSYLIGRTKDLLRELKRVERRHRTWQKIGDEILSKIEDIREEVHQICRVLLKEDSQ